MTMHRSYKHTNHPEVKDKVNIQILHPGWIQSLVTFAKIRNNRLPDDYLQAEICKYPEARECRSSGKS